MINYKTLIYILIFLNTFFLIANNSKSSDEKIIIEINTIDYIEYLKKNSPLDKLYRKGNNYYFITSKEKHEELLNNGIKVHIKKKLPRTGKSKSVASYKVASGDISFANAKNCAQFLSYSFVPHKLTFGSLLPVSHEDFLSQNLSDPQSFRHSEFPAGHATEIVTSRLIEYELMQSTTNTSNNDYNGAYHNYKETNDLLNDLQIRFPDNARVFSIGKSVEGRDLNIIHISKNINTNLNKQNVFIVGCHHAREWISVEVPLLFAKHILENQDNEDIKKALSGANIYILPILNPDGLEFSIHNYRYWRKNRKYNGDFIWGVDLNRNYGYMWGLDDQGSSSSANSEVYRGIAPFSEPETEALRQFLLANPPAGSISYHNYSQLILLPWGYKYERPDDFEEMQIIASEMSERIYSINGRRYDYGGAEALYLVNGSSDDWIYGTFKTPSFTIELPPTNALIGGFYTSEEEINLAFNENLPALLYFINYFVDKNIKDKEQIRKNKLNAWKPRPLGIDL